MADSRGSENPRGRRLAWFSEPEIKRSRTSVVLKV
jgi:hypothetical protein